MLIFDKFSSESLKLTGGLLNYFDHSLKLEVEHAKAQRNKNCNNFLEKCALDFVLLTLPQRASEKEESQADFERKATMKLLLETNFWRNITGYVEENRKGYATVQLKWQGLLSESIEPLLQRLNAWSVDSANVRSR
jgi:hypothetical protein